LNSYNLDYTKYYAQLQKKQTEFALEKTDAVSDEVSEEDIELEMQEVLTEEG
jgi:hypothetical protein